MAVPPRPPDSSIRRDYESNTGLRRWLYLGGIVVAIVILVAVVLHLSGGGLGSHGPARHAPPDHGNGHTRGRHGGKLSAIRVRSSNERRLKGVGAQTHTLKTWTSNFQMATVRARLEDVKRDLDIIERRWVEAIRELGSAYSEAYRQHSTNLPGQLPPDAHVVLIGKIVGSVTGAGAGAVFNPVAAAVIATTLGNEIENFATKIGSHPKPEELGQPNIDTPQKYQNDYTNYISRIFGRMEIIIDWLLEVIDGLRKIDGTVTHDHVDQFIDIINRSPIVHAPTGAANWNNGKALEIEMEKAMWATWVLQLEEDKGKKLLQAAQLDLDPPLKRMQKLGLLHKDITAGDSYKVRLSAAIVMLKWAKQYKASRPFTKNMPYPAKQKAQSASSHFVNQITSSLLAARELRRVVFEGVA